VIDDLPVFEWPDWYRPSKSRPRQNSAVARGLHPMGMRLAANSEKCSSCAFLVLKKRAGRWYKCTKTRMAGSVQTDIRLRWAACELWKAEPCGD